ncbi:hypothetical protein GO988_21670 [Hymenobacter sp. HMF4947]|uniref:Uncharacterized protein n=1 Tax=Hymenobacter ginkgonis TaxID=2682976 RepID=A0A7K1TKK6_9BACT|nr:hypothetical protein [Hymenobacter ginkgonis]MVN78947.1 hypothetical protein [Hymenobacter ginkgonis]
MHLLDPNKEWHHHAHEYMKCFMDSDWTMYLSTIAIAEWCVKGQMHQLPLQNLQILPFAVSHAERAGAFTAVALQNRPSEPNQRALVKNDTKLFAQADEKNDITYYLSSDNKSEKLFQQIIRSGYQPRFRFASLCLPIEQTLPVRPAIRGLFGI